VRAVRSVFVGTVDSIRIKFLLLMMIYRSLFHKDWIIEVICSLFFRFRLDQSHWYFIQPLIALIRFCNASMAPKVPPTSPVMRITAAIAAEKLLCIPYIRQ
jgi:hypothetical protein